MMNPLRPIVALALFLTISLVCADETAAEIDCGKDCADFVASAVAAAKAPLEADLDKCHKANDELTKEHDETVASLKSELAQLQDHAKKSGELERELRDLEKKYGGELDQQKAMLEKAHELAKRSQQDVIEAKMEISNLLDSLGSTRINFKLIWEDAVGLWKGIRVKVVEKFKKDADETKTEM